MSAVDMTPREKQAVIVRLRDKRLEELACHAFAVHLAHCDACLSARHKPGSAGNLCHEGAELRDSHIKAARVRAITDPDFGRRFASLIV